MAKCKDVLKCPMDSTLADYKKVHTYKCILAEVRMKEV